MRIKGKIALITGGASGIGRSCTETLAREGAAVILADVQEAHGRDIVAQIVKAGGNATYLHLDVTSEPAWADVIARIEDRFGALNVLVNNAGIAISAPSITQISLADFRKQQAVNVEGVFLGLKHAIPLMRKSGLSGSIINMSSVAGLKGVARLPVYSASKAAVLMLTKSVALECGEARDGIRVNSIHPGLIETPIWNDIGNILTSGGEPVDLNARSRETVPLGFKGLPQDVANAVLWLASDESRYITGAELVVDGGLSER
ncbi:SDR family NAD(P)-dependent oxidoreductase [Tardiphaga sp. 538_B7_N1_4]|uniref:SDR family NAD(P)-dependent oxidoreductase n=1 Tax=Tardiphaga sp. 538_B7_N1_4 TaxID=3240778 RepID=UPI001B89DBC5|nr:glucose 1-dehydrogenase [Bradyrhizobium diazoefficiens]MBR0967351.1 glucose 1-dehydrogenase [Bradyrhizobium diazoefficiens]MBR0976672.1 glucose 1-dehydrogenase [Bradyrhizobium diazoefficiens]MBR1005317.1 glucose 1-dehydrogenase [Bradyrhizobium diazoefficiens]MBR1011790.1 glucose 1-dehydrogenase [Bradyrhizobium diazoefficiens]MBR1049131.1 glucose 1-dehydrogenase [Bradyrhizobium diazoefficiens]